VLAEMRHRLLCAVRPDPRQQLQNAKTGEGVPRVFRPAQDCQQVLDVCCLDKFEPAIFDEGDVAARQLDLQPPAMVRGAEQDGLVAQIDPGLAVLQDLVGDIDCLRHFVLDGHQVRQLGRQL
jgi:hypothetical protein